MCFVTGSLVEKEQKTKWQLNQMHWNGLKQEFQF